jgi:16S rRNA (cytidine1402-2'-O)-methyltransferase
VSTLYVVGVPAGDPEHLTLRARRILGEVPHVVVDAVAPVRPSLAELGIAPLQVGEDTVGLLQAGDLALVVSGWPGAAGRALVQAAAGQGHDVAAVPGPALPVTALILSGLPADAFLYLGRLPAGAAARRRLASAAHRQHTLLALAGPPLGDILADLHEALGDRPLAVVPASSLDSRGVWRGSLAAAADREVPWPAKEACALVIGGARAEPERWDAERLAAEIEARLAQGQRAKEISRHLSGPSGWSRRQVYDLVLHRVREGGKAARTHTNNE